MAALDEDDCPAARQDEIRPARQPGVVKRRKDFWGATEQPDGTLVGMSVLRRLLMELREELKRDAAAGLRFAEPLQIPDFLLFGQARANSTFI